MENSYTLKDKNGNIVIIDKDGYDSDGNRYVIYKIKKGV
jgi:hypothetical protein